MAVSEQSISDGVAAIRAGKSLKKYMNEYDGVEDKDELSLELRCKLVEDYPNSDILAQISQIEAHIAKLSPGPGKDRHQTMLDALNAEKTSRGI